MDGAAGAVRDDRGCRMTRLPSSAKRNGDALETDLVNAHLGFADWYVHQNHPRVLRGQPVGKGPPDFIAIGPGGARVLFDAKSTTGARWPVSNLLPHQAAAFDLFTRAGGTAGVYLRTSEGDCWIPWATLRPLWQDHWQRRGTACLTRADGVAVKDCDWRGAALP